MGNFQRDGNRGGGFRGGNGGDFKKKSWGNDRDRAVSMHKATCSECSKTCEVPFRPSGDKPVYCNDCFAGKREDNSNDRGGRGDFRDRAPKREFNDRSVAPRTDFTRPASANNDDVKKQLSELSMKLDRLVSAVEKLSQHKEAAPAVKLAHVASTAVKAEVKKVAPKPAAKKAVEVKAPAKTAAKKVAPKKVVAKKKNN